MATRESAQWQIERPAGGVPGTPLARRDHEGQPHCEARPQQGFGCEEEGRRKRDQHEADRDHRWTPAQGAEAQQRNRQGEVAAAGRIDVPTFHQADATSQEGDNATDEKSTTPHPPPRDPGPQDEPSGEQEQRQQGRVVRSGIAAEWIRDLRRPLQQDRARGKVAVVPCEQGLAVKVVAVPAS